MRARGLFATRLSRLVDQHIAGREFAVLGEPRVHLLRLNMALEALR